MRHLFALVAALLLVFSLSADGQIQGKGGHLPMNKSANRRGASVPPPIAVVEPGGGGDAGGEDPGGGGDAGVEDPGGGGDAGVEDPGGGGDAGSGGDDGTPQWEPSQTAFASLTGPQEPLPCTEADGCSLDCGIGIVTGGRAWECVNGQGVPVPSGSDSAGFVAVAEGPVGYALWTSAASGATTAPAVISLAEASPFNSSLIGSDSTAFCAHSGLGAGGYTLSTSPLALLGMGKCRYYLGSGSFDIGQDRTGGFGWTACRKQGTTYAQVLPHGITPGTSAGALRSTGLKISFGAQGYSSMPTLPSRGATSRCRLYSRALADAEIRSLAARLSGTHVGNAPIATTRSGKAPVFGAREGENFVRSSSGFESASVWYYSTSRYSLVTANGSTGPRSGEMTADLFEVTSAVVSPFTHSLPHAEISDGPVTVSAAFRSDTPGLTVGVAFQNSAGIRCSDTTITAAGEWHVLSCTAAATLTTQSSPQISLYVNGFGATANPVGSRIWVADAQVTRGGPKEFAATDGTVRSAGPHLYEFASNVARINPNLGLLTLTAKTNLVPDSHNPSVWPVRLGTHTLQVQTRRTSFARVQDATTAVCGQFVDSDSVAEVGRGMTAVAVSAGAYVASAFLRPGTITDPRLVLANSGGSPDLAACTFNLVGLPEEMTCSGDGSTLCEIQCADGRACSEGNGKAFEGDLVRAVCYADLPAVGALSAQVRSSPVLSKTGNFTVCHFQAEPGRVASPPLLCGASACSTPADVHTVSTEGWPVNQGEIAFDYTPLSATPTGYLLDTRDSEVGGGISLRHSGDYGLVFAVHRAGGATQEAHGLGLDWEPMATRRIVLRWGAGMLEVRVEAEIVASVTRGAFYTPDSHGTVAHIGSSFAGADQIEGYIKDFVRNSFEY